MTRTLVPGAQMLMREPKENPLARTGAGFAGMSPPTHTTWLTTQGYSLSVDGSVFVLPAAATTTTFNASANVTPFEIAS